MARAGRFSYLHVLCVEAEYPHKPSGNGVTVYLEPLLEDPVEDLKGGLLLVGVPGGGVLDGLLDNFLQLGFLRKRLLRLSMLYLLRLLRLLRLLGLVLLVVLPGLR